MADALGELAAVPLASYAIFALTITLAGILQGTTGVGYGLIAGPVLVLLDPSFVPGAVLVTGLFVTALTAWRERQFVRWDLLGAGIAGRVPGALLGAWLVLLLSPAAFGIAFGAMVLLAVGISLLGARFEATRASVAAAGVVSGIMGTITSAGAPPMAIVMQNQPSRQMRATVSAFLLLGALISIAALALVDRFGIDDLARALVLIPFCVLGFRLSGPLIGLKALDATLRPLVLSVCAAMSLLLILRSLSGMG